MCVLFLVFRLSLNNLPNKPGVTYLPWFHSRESFCCQDDRGVWHRSNRSQRLKAAVPNTSLCCNVVIPFGFSWDLHFAQRKTTCTISSFFFIYSDALQSWDNITFYLLQTLNGHGYQCLGNEKCNHLSFSVVLFDYFMFDKLENNFLLYIVYLYLYIYIQKKYIYNVNV